MVFVLCAGECSGSIRENSKQLQATSANMVERQIYEIKKQISSMHSIELVKSAQGRNTASVFGSSARDEMSQTRTRCAPRVRRERPVG